MSIVLLLYNGISAYNYGKERSGVLVASSWRRLKTFFCSSAIQNWHRRRQRMKWNEIKWIKKSLWNVSAFDPIHWLCSVAVRNRKRKKKTPNSSILFCWIYHCLNEIYNKMETKNIFPCSLKITRVLSFMKIKWKRERARDSGERWEEKKDVESLN